MTLDMQQDAFEVMEMLSPVIQIGDHGPHAVLGFLGIQGRLFDKTATMFPISAQNWSLRTFKHQMTSS